MKNKLLIIKTLGVLSALVFALGGCSKIDYISSFDDTYVVISSGNTEFFKTNGKFSQMVTANKGNYYINPEIMVVTGSSDAKISDASVAMLSKIENSLFELGYRKTLDKSEADFVVQATNFILVYTNINWVPGAYLDPYYAFWGGYTPWMWYNVTIATNKLLIECVEAESMTAYQDWYNNTWKPANPGKYPTPNNVPGDKKPIMAWQIDITGELEDNKVNDNNRLTSKIDRSFSQTATKKDDKGATIPFPNGSFMFFDNTTIE